MPVSKKNLDNNLKLRAISRRMEKSLNSTKAGQFVLQQRHLADVAANLQETFKNEFLGLPLNEVLSDYTVAVINAAEGRIDERVLARVFDLRARKGDGEGEGTWSRDLWEFGDFPLAARKAKTVKEAEGYEKALAEALRVIEQALPFVEVDA